MNKLIDTINKQVKDDALRAALLKLLEAPKFKDNFSKYLDDPMTSAMLPFILKGVEAYTNRQEAETSCMQSSLEMAPLCSGNTNNNNNTTDQSDCSSAQRLCPFVKHGDDFYLLRDGKEELLENKWTVNLASAWICPLSEQNIQEYKAFKPFDSLIGAFWSGVSKKAMGALLPPVHAVLVFRLEDGVDKLWMAYDCGKGGIGVVAVADSQNGFPKKELFKSSADTAICLRSFNNPSYKDRPLQLYDLLEYGWAHTTPISLKWHLEQHKDDVIEAITKYCNTTCWGFVNGVLEMFDSYRLAMDNDAIAQHLAL